VDAERTRPLAAQPGFESPLLHREYDMLVFDWDGTAVPSRRHATDALRERTEALARLDVWLVAVTGTHFDNLNEQYFRFLSPQAKRRHLACVNRGSEVYGFDRKGRTVLLMRVEASERSNDLMDEIALRVQSDLKERYGLETEIVFDRLNRRKLDLIPEPEWRDPPKEKIGELLRAVRARLSAAGVEGGILEIMNRVVSLAEDLDIKLKLTTDVKHVEFGLTDKSDSMEYIETQLAEELDIPAERIMVLGDEFGPIDRFEGSDFKMLTLEGPSYVSVGKEPNGAPEGVLHIGGGASSFLDLLDLQVDLRREE